MAQPRIQHKRGSTGPTSASGITAGEFAIALGTGPNGPIGVFIGASGSTTPVRVGAKVITDVTAPGANTNDTIPTTAAISSWVGVQLTQSALGVCFMEYPAEGNSSIEVRTSPGQGGPNSGFSGFYGVTFALSFSKASPPTTGTGSEGGNGAHWGHRLLVGGVYDQFDAKRLLLGQLLSYIGVCAPDQTDIIVDEYGTATVVGLLDSDVGALGFTGIGLTYGEVPVWGDSGWTAQRFLGNDGIQIDSLTSGGVSFSLEPIYATTDVVGSISSPLEIPVLTVDKYGRVTARSDGSLNLYNVIGGFTGYISPVFKQYFESGSTFFEGNYISSDFTNNEIILTNTGITGISVNGTYYTGGIILSAGSGISLAASGSNPEIITITNLGAVGVSGNISLQGHTQGNVYLSNFTGSQNLVITKGGYGDGFDPVTGRCGYAVFVGLSSGIQLPSNISAASNAFISIPTGFTGFGGFGGVCFGQSVSGGTGGARGFLEVNRIQATGNNRISSGWGASTPGKVLELDAGGGTWASGTANASRNGRNAKIVLASFPSDQWNLLTDINGNTVSYASNGLFNNVTQPSLNNVMPGLSAIANANDIQSGTVRLYNNARVEKHMVVGANLYVLGNYYDNQGATVEFTKLAYIANNNFAGTIGQGAFTYPTGATFGYGILSLGASGTSGHDVGILFNAKSGNSGPTAGFFGFDSSSQAFTFRVASTTFGISYSSAGELSLNNAIAAPLIVGAINGITLGLHSGTTLASILLQPGHRLGLCGPFGLTFGITGNNTVIIPAESTQPTTLVTLTNIQTMTNKTLGADCVIDCGTY